jgi:hypothetical protein
MRLTVEDFEEDGNPKRGDPPVLNRTGGDGAERKPDGPGAKA